MSFWDFWWLLFLGYLLLAWLVMLYAIIRDLLQAPELSGVAKALWTIGLIAVPVPRLRDLPDRTGPLPHPPG
jgi:hypothetical protein